MPSYSQFALAYLGGQFSFGLPHRTLIAVQEPELVHDIYPLPFPAAILILMCFLADWDSGKQKSAVQVKVGKEVQSSEVITTV